MTIRVPPASVALALASPAFGLKSTV